MAVLVSEGSLTAGLTVKREALMTISRLSNHMSAMSLSSLLEDLIHGCKNAKREVACGTCSVTLRCLRGASSDDAAAAEHR